MPVEEKTFVMAAIAAIGGAISWLYVRIGAVSESKLSKDVFDEFKNGNTLQHKQTHDQLNRIEEKLNK